MNIKHLSLHLGLGVALAISGIVSRTPQAQAQSGTQSDISGVIVTTSDAAGGFSPGGGQTTLAFRTDQIRNSVNIAAASVNRQLTARNLPIVANGPSTAIPAAVQQNIECVTTGSSGACVTQLERGLVNAGTNPVIARNLAASLERLTANGNVEPGRMVAVVRAYNALIGSSSAAFLSNPPEELRAIQSILSILLNAAYTPTRR